MFYIKLDNRMDLVVTVREAIYRGDHLNQKLTFLVPMTVGDIDIGASALYLSYIRADGTADIDLLNREQELYNENYYRFTMPVTSKLTRYAGPVTVFITIFSGPFNSPVIAKTGECILNVQASTNMDDVVTDQNLSMVYRMQKQMEDRVAEAERALNERIDDTNAALEETNAVLAGKADNIVFHQDTQTLQLTSDGQPIGDPIEIRVQGSAASIEDAYINEDGELVVKFDNGTVKTLGKVVGKDGGVYVPHVDERNILTFTFEEAPSESPGEIVPPPVDMNPYDEWGDIVSGEGDDGVVTPYLWDTL